MFGSARKSKLLVCLNSGFPLCIVSYARPGSLMLQAVSYQYEKYLRKSINKELGTESLGGFVEVGGDFYRYVQFCYVVINIDDANVFAEYLEKCSIY